jgi:hypothetical protein
MHALCTQAMNKIMGLEWQGLGWRALGTQGRCHSASRHSRWIAIPISFLLLARHKSLTKHVDLKIYLAQVGMAASDKEVGGILSKNTNPNGSSG